MSDLSRILSRNRERQVDSANPQLLILKEESTEKSEDRNMTTKNIEETR